MHLMECVEDAAMNDQKVIKVRIRVACTIIVVIVIIGVVIENSRAH